MSAPPAADPEETCPACGGGGGGPFGRAGSAWDDDAYVCVRCEGTGVLRAPISVPRPGLAKPRPDAPAKKKKRAAG